MKKYIFFLIFFKNLKSRPASPNNARRAPTAPSAASKPVAPASGFQQQQQQQPQPSQMNYNQNQSQQNTPSLNLNITPGNLISAFQTATNLSNTFNSIKDKVQPPSRPAPVPTTNAAQNNLQNPLIPS